MSQAHPQVGPETPAERAFLLTTVQPALNGLMDGSVSSLAPIFAVAFATHNPWTTFLVGLATACGAAISMGFAEALSDSGELTGRGSPIRRGVVVGLATFAGGVFHTIPFLIGDYVWALTLACLVVGVELLLIAGIRHYYFESPWWRSILEVMGGGALVFLAAWVFGNA